ncbi:hypothetical protein D3C81_500640 [compost metagenome]
MSKRKRLISSYDNSYESDYTKKSRAMKDLDPDLLEYFDDIRLSKNKKSSSKSTKSRFAIGDQVCVGSSYGTIVLGPYKSASNKDTYEIETEDNQFITAEDDGKAITEYIPPEEEKSDDDDLF